MADSFWTTQRIQELTRDLERDKDRNEDAAWLLERLRAEPDKAEYLTTLDTVSELSTVTWEGEDKQQYSRLIGYLKDWRKRHGVY